MGRNTAVALETTVVVIAYRRPSLVKLQMRGLAGARPPALLVACDVPPSGNCTDVEKIYSAIRDGVTWPCDVSFDVAPHHLGLNDRVTTAIDLALGSAAAAIVLEDDCVPHPDFFRFATCLLERYRRDDRVHMIAGGRPRSAPRWGTASYYFSRYPFIWGWSTWADRWNRASFTTRPWTSADERLLQHHFTGHELEYWRRMTAKSVTGWGSWDYRWFLEMLQSDGLCAVPNVNLVRNVGFGAGATHTSDPADYPSRSIPVAAMERGITHTDVVERDQPADFQAFREVFLRG